MSAPLDWSYRATAIPEAGLREDRVATEDERARAAAQLEVVSCERLAADFTIRAIGQGHYRLSGKVTAQLTQSCVVTLDPIAQSVVGSFDVEFWPPGKQPESGEDEVEALSAAEIEPIEHGQIDAGRIVFETFPPRSIPTRASQGPSSRRVRWARSPNRTKAVLSLP